MLAASDGKEESKYIGEFLLKSASKFSEQLIYGLIANRNNYESDLPIEKVKGAISLFYLICDDGNMGLYHDDLIKMYLYLSRLQYERGYRDEAFDSLESALNHAKALENLCDGKEHTLTATLVSFVKYKTLSLCLMIGLFGVIRIIAQLRKKSKLTHVGMNGLRKLMHSIDCPFSAVLQRKATPSFS